MSQHDFDIANQGFPATRADLNNALKAAVSNSAGTSAPSTTYAYQFWYDSTNNIIKMRNGDNDAWISVATVDQTNDLVSITHTGMLDLVDDDGSASIRFQAPSTVTSTTTFTLPDGDGDSGQTLITNGSGTLAWAAPYGNRNLIINGAMQVNQRGDQTSSAGSSKYFVDRFNVYVAATAVASLTQSTDVPSGQGFTSSAKIDVTTANASPAASDEAHFRQVLEGQDLQHLCYGTSSAKKLTLSFWVKSSKTGTHIIEFYNAASAGAKQQSQSYTISAADTWEKKSITIDGDTSTIIDNTTSAEFYVQWVLQAGSNFTSGTLNTSWNSVTNANRYVGQVNFFDNTSNNMFITGVQLEVGEQATPFEHRSYADELARCQRYYERRGGASYQALGSGLLGNGRDQTRITLNYNEKRAVPSIAVEGSLISTNRENYEADITGLTGTAAGTMSAYLACTHSAAGTGLAAALITVKNGSPNSFFEIESEL